MTPIKALKSKRSWGAILNWIFGSGFDSLYLMMTAMKGSVVAWVKLMVRKNSAIATAAEEQLGGRVSNLRAI
jgi:hypothetical protein